MKTGTYTEGSASARISYSQLVAPSLRGRLREVSSLVCDAAHRGHGHATALLQKLCRLADADGITLMVVVDPFDDEPINADSLRQWYERHGFIEIQVMPCVMARQATRALNG